MAKIPPHGVTFPPTERSDNLYCPNERCSEYFKPVEQPRAVGNLLIGCKACSSLLMVEDVPTVASEPVAPSITVEAIKPPLVEKTVEVSVDKNTPIVITVNINLTIRS